MILFDNYEKFLCRTSIALDLDHMHAQTHFQISLYVLRFLFIISIISLTTRGLYQIWRVHAKNLN